MKIADVELNFEDILNIVKSKGIDVSDNVEKIYVDSSDNFG